MERVYARHAYCHALQLRQLQRVHGLWPLWKVFAFRELQHDTDLCKNEEDLYSAVFASLNTLDDASNEKKYFGRLWPARDCVETQADFQRLLAAWKASVPDLSSAELWTLVGTVLGHHLPVDTHMPNLVWVRLEPGCSADVRFRAVVPACVLTLCRARGEDMEWPADAASPLFSSGFDYVSRHKTQEWSCTNAFEKLRAVFGASVTAVVAGGLVASVMSTHWAQDVPGECDDTCPCRLAADVDVMTTNKGFAGVCDALKGVSGLDISEVPFFGVRRLLAEFDMTHNQGALVVGPSGDLWVGATPDAFASWATMHTKCTGRPFTARRLLKAESKGFKVHTCGKEPWGHLKTAFDGMDNRSKVTWVAKCTDRDGDDVADSWLH
jgi:hypothetical protein